MTNLSQGAATPKNANEKNNNKLTTKGLEIWPERINGQKLFKDLTSVFSRHLALQKFHSETLALWTIFSHCYDASDIAPKLLISSPEKGCGKSTLMEVLEGLVWKPIMSSNITPAVIFRVIETVGGTLMIDEADTFITKSDDMRGIINCGHKRSSAHVWRCVGDHQTPTQFSVWAPMVIAMIGKPADTIVDRSIAIEMRRKTTDEQIERFSSRKNKPELEELTRKIMRWCQDNFADLCDADPIMPEGLRDRTMDNWRPLLAIADLIGGNCPATARFAAIELNETVEDDDNASAATMLLADIQDIFELNKNSRLSTQALIENLCDMDDRPWLDWNRGRSITPRQVATKLKPFGITPRKMRIYNENVRGYERDQFDDAFARYLAGTTEQTNKNNRLETPISGTVPNNVPDRTEVNTLKNNESSVVPDRRPDPQQVKEWFKKRQEEILERKRQEESELFDR
jgi:hypothetical protein